MADGSSPGTTIGRSTPDSQIVVDIDMFASWDALDDPSNDTLIVPLGAGAIMTGIGWDVGITTVGGSYRSEARMYFDGQDLDGTGLFLTPGVADASSGTGTYSSGGVLDLTDNGITDIAIGPDGNLYIQFYEGYDDVADAIDANYDAPSSLTIAYIAGQAPPTPTSNPDALNPIPTMNRFGIIAMAALLLGVAVLVISRRR
jgi:hypothetical protein